MTDELEGLSDAEFFDLLFTRLEAKGDDMTAMRAYAEGLEALEAAEDTPLPPPLRHVATTVPDLSVYEPEDAVPAVSRYPGGVIDLAPVMHSEGVPEPEDIEDLISPDKPLGPRTLRRWHREAQHVHRLQWASIVFVLLVAPWLSVVIFRLWPWW